MEAAAGELLDEDDPDPELDLSEPPELLDGLSDDLDFSAGLSDEAGLSEDFSDDELDDSPLLLALVLELLAASRLSLR